MNANVAAGTTPFHFDFRAGDLGHTLIVGQTSAGKSITLPEMSALYTPASHDASKASRRLVLEDGTPGARTTLPKPNAGDDAWK